MRTRLLAALAAAGLVAGTLALAAGPAQAAGRWPEGERCGAFVYPWPRNDFVQWKHCTSGRDGVKLKVDLVHAFDRTVCVGPNRIKSVASIYGTRKVKIIGRC